MSTPKPNLRIRLDLATVREREGVTQQQLAVSAGLSIGTVSSIERGETDPKLSTLFRIARGLGVPIRDLIVVETRGSGPRSAS